MNRSDLDKEHEKVTQRSPYDGDATFEPMFRPDQVTKVDRLIESFNGKKHDRDEVIWWCTRSYVSLTYDPVVGLWHVHRAGKAVMANLSIRDALMLGAWSSNGSIDDFLDEISQRVDAMP